MKESNWGTEKKIEILHTSAQRNFNTYLSAKVSLHRGINCILCTVPYFFAGTKRKLNHVGVVGRVGVQLVSIRPVASGAPVTSTMSRLTALEMTAIPKSEK